MKMGLLHIGEESFVTEALFIHKALALHRNSGHQHDQDIIKTFYSYYQNYNPFFYQKIVSQQEKTEDIFGKPSSDLNYLCTPTELVMVDILNPQDILLKSISINEQNNGPEKEVYFYHGDHLGSANWIADKNGAPVQPSADFISKPALFYRYNLSKSTKISRNICIYAKNVVTLHAN